ncbi:hypothetical protein JCM17478_00450 [Thermopirellula anaerolimosa]
MLSERAEHTLTAALQCISACRLLCDTRRSVERYVSCYEPCLDKALAQALGLFFALMEDFATCTYTDDAMPALELGSEPETYRQAVATLEDFLALAEGEMRHSLATGVPSPDAMAIAQRALTYAYLFDPELEA